MWDNKCKIENPNPTLIVTLASLGDSAKFKILLVFETLDLHARSSSRAFEMLHSAFASPLEKWTALTEQEPVCKSSQHNTIRTAIQHKTTR